MPRTASKAIRPTLQQALGPAAAGMLVGATFPWLGATTVAALFAFGLLLLAAMRPGPAATAGEMTDRPHPLADLRDGLRFVVRTSWLLWTLLFASMWVLAALGPIDVLLPFITRDRFPHGEQMYGFVLAAFGIGRAPSAPSPCRHGRCRAI